MPAFCDVALPVPLDRAFTYRIPDGEHPVIGGRVLAPFRNQKLSGVVLRMHDKQPENIDVKPLASVVDSEPVLSEELIELAEWVASYYITPIGEVVRSMLPLMHEVRRENLYRIAESGREVLFNAANQGASRRSKLGAEAQQAEYAVLNALLAEDSISARSLAARTSADRELLNGMVRKKWITREQQAASRASARTVRVASLNGDVRLPRLNAQQQALLAELAAQGGSMTVAALRERKLSESSLQTLVRRGAVAITEQPMDFAVSSLLPQQDYPLNRSQLEALATISASMAKREFSTTLLYGVTGSGKTAVYLAAMQRALDNGQSSLLLVPEIGLTPAMAATLHRAFGENVALLHSALTPGERAEQWHRIRRGEARIVVGTRSAVFAPVQNLALLIVDEEHDHSYKQEETPRYHARDVAVVRGKLAGIPVLLGSATPSLESWHNAERGRYARIVMSERVADRPMPEVECIDMRREFEETGHDQLFSHKLVTEITAALERDEQAIVLLNRRGYSFVVMCRSCGAKMECENCAIALTYHRPVEHPDEHSAAGQRLECHYCGYRRTVPKHCPKCDSEHLHFFGAGSQQGQERLHELFPHARIGRMDRDTVRGRHDLEHLLSRLHSGELNLLVGTQMIAKGHDIHGVTLVGVVGADHALSLPDFRAAERVFQLLTQVSGRAGRGALPGRVVVQTYYPEHYAIQFAAKHDFDGFAERELHFRKLLFYPPFTAIANVLIRGRDLGQVSAWVEEIRKWLDAQRSNRSLSGARLLGPAPAPIPRLKGLHRFHFVLKSPRRDVLAILLRNLLQFAAEKNIPRSSLIVDMDAISLM
jgi:primosomal protein N' (replication factor Y) (superfamily II helicase)